MEELSGLEIVQASMSGDIRVPLMDTMGMVYESVDEHAVSIALPVETKILNERGVVHSGALFSVMDAAGGLAARATLPKGKSYLVSGFQASLASRLTGTEGRLIARASVVTGYEEGLSNILTNVQLSDEHGRILAQAQLSNAVLDASPASSVQEDTDALKNQFNLEADVPFLNTLGIANDPQCLSSILLQPSSHLNNSIGTVHGGVILTAMAAAANRHVQASLRDGQCVNMSSISALYLRAVQNSSDPVIAKASTIKPGSTVSSVRAILGGQGKASATADIGYTVSTMER